MRVHRNRRFELGAAVLASALGVGAAWSGGGAAFAQGAPPSPPSPSPTYPECTKKASKDDTDAAKNAHRVATQFYERADYDKAIQYWTDAYKFDCSANDLLLNIANAYEKKGDRAATIATIEAYLKRAGSNPTLEEKVKNLRALMAAPPAPTTPPTPPTPPPTQPVPLPSAAPTTAPPPPDGVRPYGAKPWFLVGGGGALALVGIILLPIGYGNTSSAGSTCPNSVCPNTPAGNSAASSGNAGRSEIGAGWALLGVGAAAAAGGLVWQFAFNKPEASATPQSPSGKRPGSVAQSLWFTPTASKDGSGVVLGGSF